MSILCLLLTGLGQLTISIYFSREGESILQKVYVGFAWPTAGLWFVFAIVNLRHAFNFTQLEHPIRWLLVKSLFSQNFASP